MKAEQKKLTKAVAIADDVPDLVTELRQRATARAAWRCGSRRSGARRKRRAGKIENAEALVRHRLGDVRTALRERGDLRRVFLRLFPEGIRFHPARIGNQQVWKIAGKTNYGQLVEGDGLPVFTLESDPNVPGFRLQDDSAFEFWVLDGRPVEYPRGLYRSSKPEG